jgi:anti-sigma factor RsiW
MMSCPKYASLISVLIDGELPPAQQSSVQEHLSRCPHCRNLRAAWEFHGKACRGYFSQHALTEDFVVRVRHANQMASAARTNKEKGWLQRDLFAWLQAAAAFLAIAVLLNQFFPWEARKAIGQVLNPGMRLELRASESADWRPAPAGIALYPGDWLRNTEHSAAEILIHEASRLTLQGGTVAQLGSGTRDSKNQL